MGIKKKWVRLKKVIQRLLRIEFPPQQGDGGAHSDKGLILTRPKIDSTLTIKDTATIARPMNQ